MIDIHRGLDSPGSEIWGEEKSNDEKGEQDMEARTFSPGSGRRREVQEQPGIYIKSQGSLSYSRKGWGVATRDSS